MVADSSWWTNLKIPKVNGLGGLWSSGWWAAQAGGLGGLSSMVEFWAVVIEAVVRSGSQFGQRLESSRLFVFFGNRRFDPGGQKQVRPQLLPVHLSEARRSGEGTESRSGDRPGRGAAAQ